MVVLSEDEHVVEGRWTDSDGRVSRNTLVLCLLMYMPLLDGTSMQTFNTSYLRYM